MKHLSHFLLGILCTLLVLSCCKEQPKKSGDVTVLFTYQMMEEGSMTKTAVHDEIVALISKNLPELTLSLLSKETGHSYTCKTGEQITIPEGVYTFSYTQETERYAGAETPGSSTSTSVSSIPQLSKKPQIKIIESEVTISNEQSVISLNAVFDCFAIVIDKAETKKVNFSNCTLSGMTRLSGQTIEFISSENICVSFLALNYGEYKFYVLPSDETKYLSKTYSIICNSTSTRLATGKYYRLHPYSISNTMASINVDYPDWTEGTL